MIMSENNIFKFKTKHFICEAVKNLLFLRVHIAVIGQFCMPYFTLQLTKFESFLS